MKEPNMATNSGFEPVQPTVEATITIEQIPGAEMCKVVIGEMRLTGTLPKNIVDDPDDQVRYANASDKEFYVDGQISWAKTYYKELVRNVKRMLHDLPVLDELRLGKPLDDVLGFEVEDVNSIPEDMFEAALKEAEAPYWEAVDAGNALDIDVPVTKAVAEAAVAYFKRELATRVQLPINGNVWNTWEKYVREHPETYTS